MNQDQDIYVPPFLFFCPIHQKKDVTKINLGAVANKQNRLRCDECKDGIESNNIFPIYEVFSFLTDIQTKYKCVHTDINRIKQLFKNVRQTIEEFLDNLAKKIQEFEFNIEQKKLIKQNILEKCLSRNNEYTSNDLADFMEIVSQNTKIVNSQIKLKNPYFNEEDKEQKKRLENKLKDQLELYKEYKITNEIVIPEGISDIDFNYNGQLLAIVNCQQKQVALQLYQIQENQMTAIIKGNPGNYVKCINFSNLTNSFVLGYYDSEAIYWEQKNDQWRQFQTLENNQLSVNCVKFSNSDLFLAIGSKKLIIHKKSNGNEPWERIFKHKMINSIQYLCFNQSDTILAIGDYSQCITVFTYEQNQWILRFSKDNLTQLPRFVAFYTEINFISVSNDKEIIRWLSKNDLYTDKSEKVNQQIISSNYSISQKILALCTQSSVELLKVSDNGLVWVQTIQVQGSIASFSKDGLKLAINSDGVLKIYSKK